MRDLTDTLTKNSILAFTTLRNERVRLSYFLDYYRDLGVDHFLIVDNGSTDGSREYLLEQGRCLALAHRGQLPPFALWCGLARLAADAVRAIVAGALPSTQTSSSYTRFVTHDHCPL